jgi:hypothetical protein
MLHVLWAEQQIPLFWAELKSIKKNDKPEQFIID